jgi:small subunit ribosomal protein S16
MALVIRLRQQGRTNRQTYRVVVADSRSPRDGKYIEMLGWYNPTQADDNAKVDAERLNYWISQGAQLSEKVEQIGTRAAPDVIKNLRTQRHDKRVKLAAKRRALKKQKSAAAPAAQPAKTTAAKKK